MVTSESSSSPFSMREWLCFFFLLMPVALAKENISLRITDFSPSEVALACHLDYDGNMTNVVFNVYKGKYSCFHRNSGSYKYNFNCDIIYEESDDPKQLLFLVKLSGSCDEIIYARCSISNAENMLDLQESITLTAQGDPPAVSVNNGHPVKASSEHVRVVCAMTNTCNKPKLEISVDAPIEHVSTTHTKAGDRFNTTAISEAIFNDAGNYTILCKEIGKEDIFSRIYTLLVHPSIKVGQQRKEENENATGYFKYFYTGIGLIASISFLLFSGCLFKVWRRYSQWRTGIGDHHAQNRSYGNEETPLLSMPGSERYMQIEKMIQQLNHFNTDKFIPRILRLVEKGDITYPEYGPSLLYKVIEKMEQLHHEPQLLQLLIDGLLPSYQKSELSKKEDLSEIIWTKLEYRSIKDGNGEQECLRKLTIFPLDATLSFRLLWRCALDSIILEEQNKLMQHHRIISKFLISHFNEKTGKSSPFYDSFNMNITFVKASLYGYMKTVKDDAGVLNFIVQSVLDFVLENESNNISSIKSLLVQNCRDMLKVDTFCNHVDGEGRTPLHNLLEKLLNNNLRREMSELAVGNESLWNLVSQLMSHKNVNICDKKGLTPYSWILWWKESLPYQDEPYIFDLEKKIAKKIEEILVLFCEQRASKEDANDGLSIHREREIGELLKMIMKRNMHIIADEATFSKLRTKVERVRKLKRKGCGKCITDLAVTEDFKMFAQNHMYIWNDMVLEMSQQVLELLIVKDNAQDIFDIILKAKNGTGNNRGKVNYVALSGVMKLCLERGACPTSDQIYEISLLNVDVCTAHEAQLAVVKIMEQLIGAYRKRGNKKPVEIYLNPVQDQWKVSEELRRAAGAVVRAACGTLNSCLKSGSVINILLFIRKDDGDDDIKKCFEEADALMQRDMRDPPVMKWAAGKRYQNVQAVEGSEIQEKLITKNDNWLKRSVLHLAAIFCQDEHILRSIPKKIVNRQIDRKDINGQTPLQIAYLHDNMPAIEFLKSRSTRSSEGYSENFPKSLESSDTLRDEEVCFDIMETKSSVFEVMKNMLIIPVECAAVEEDLKELFTRMVANDGLLNAEIFIGGGVREKLKVGNWNYFTLQIYVKKEPFQYEPLISLKLHEHLVKKLAVIDTTQIRLRCISVGDPWTFVLVGEGTCKGLPISVDVTLILIDGHRVEKHKRQELIIDNAPCRPILRYFQWNDFMSQALWDDTYLEHEWDILDNMPPQCRLGILIAMALIEALDQITPVKFMRNPVTTNVLKNTLLWILAGRTPTLIEIKNENVIGEQYGALRQQLYFEEGGTRWMTEEDLKRYANDGRFWAEKIFDAIEFMAREYRVTLDSFLTSRSHELNMQQAILVQNICKSCLKRLTPQVFFAEEEYGSSEMESVEGTLRTRLQKVIDMLNGKVGTVLPGALLWKRKKEVKQLEASVAICSTPIKERLGPELLRKKSEATKLSNEYDNQLTVLTNQEENCTKLEEEIKQLQEELGKANQKESKLFKQYGGYEEVRRENNNQTDSEWESEKCELENEIKEKRKSCDELLVKLEEKLKKIVIKST